MVTPEQAFDFLGIAEPTSTQEALVDSLIELVTAEIEAYCDRLLDQNEVVEETLKYTYYDYDLDPDPAFAVRKGQPVIRLKEYPVDDLELTENGEVVPEDDYHLYSDIGIIIGKKAFDTRFANLSADYLGGYNPVPSALQLVALQGIKAYFSDSGTTAQGNANVKSKSLDRFSVSYGNGQSLIGGTGGKTYLITNEAILSKYRRFDIWG